jgi:hypothetical protein
MIAMILVTLCALPLIQPHIYIYGKEQEAIRSLQVDHVASLIYADIVEKLYENEIDWHHLADENMKHPIDSTKLSRLAYEGYYTFSKARHKPSDEPPEGTNYLMRLSLVLNPKGSKETKNYNYLIFIKRKIKQGQDTKTVPIVNQETQMTVEDEIKKK